MPDASDATASSGSPSPRPRVAVIGGGITGLATAWYLRTGAGPVRPDVTVVEGGTRLGGKIRTEELAGVTVEAGPDTFLARVPWATDLARELGLGDDLVAPATGRAFVWHGGRLRPLPSGTVFGVPITARALLSTSLVSPLGKARAALDLVLPRRRFGPDPSVAEVVGARLGREVLDHLVEPLVGGINAGRADALSLRSAARQLSLAAEGHRSLVLGLRAARARRGGAQADGPVFVGLRGGMERLVDRLVSSLHDVDVRLGTTVTTLSRTADAGLRGPNAMAGLRGPNAMARPRGPNATAGRWLVACDTGAPVEADAVVLTVPAFAAAPVLAAVAPDAATELSRIRHSSVVTATLAYHPSALAKPLDGSGFLVPRGEGTLVTACTFTTSKWPGSNRAPGALADDANGAQFPGLRGPNAMAGDLVLLRASAGRVDDERALGLDDAALVDRLHHDLAGILGLTEASVASRVDRWPNGFPQHEPGHEARVQRIETALGALGGVYVAGAAYRGLGIAACVQQAESTAGQIMGYLSHHRVAARET